MTKIAVFDAKPYDRASFDAANAARSWTPSAAAARRRGV